MSDESPSVWKRIISVPVEIVVGLFLVLDAVIAPLFRPFMRALSSLKLIQRMEQGIDRMPPYLILVLLVVPFGFAELTKVYAVILMAEEHMRLGMTLFIGAYIVSILVCERTFHAGKGQLMKIGWFKLVFDWLMAIKEHVFRWCRRTAVWQAGVRLKERCRLALTQARDRLRETAGRKATFAGKPRDSLERP